MTDNLKPRSDTRKLMTLATCLGLPSMMRPVLFFAAIACAAVTTATSCSPATANANGNANGNAVVRQADAAGNEDAAKFDTGSKVRGRPTTFKNPGLIEFHRQIDFDQTRYFKNRFAAAKRAGVDLLVVEINSPGGLKIESLEMAAMLRDCDWAYTVALITNEAISGGALISLGCDEIVIAPNASFGDIGEIQFDGDQGAFRLIEPKVESYLSQKARGLATAKGRPADLAEAMIDKDVMVYWNENAPLGPEFKLVRVDAKAKPQAPFELIPETGPERFLTLSGSRAKQLGIAQVLANDRTEMAKVYGVELEQFKVYRRTTTDRVVHILNLPLITGLLVIVGLISLYVELSAPGIGIGGLLAGLCTMLFFWSRFLGGTSGWLEVMLFIAGVIFILVEVFVIPGFGFAGVTGALLLVASFILAGQDFVVPATKAQTDRFVVTLLTLMGSGLTFIVAAFFVTKKMGSLPLLNHLVLDTPSLPDVATNSDGTSAKKVYETHPEIAVGDWGVSDSILRPAGNAIFAGRSFDVVSDGSYVESGQQVKVVRIQGNIITVAKVHE